MSQHNEPQLIEIAKNALQTGNLAFAKKILSDLIRLNESQWAAIELSAHIAVSEGNIDEAIRLWSKAALNPKSSNYTLYELGSLYLQKGQFQEALHSFKLAITKGGNFFELLHDQALTLAGMGQAEQAIDAMHRALDLNPNSAEAHYNLGRLLDDVKQFDQSIISYQKALSFNPFFTEAYINYGIALYELGRPAEALHFYREALKINPHSLDTLLNQGMALHALNKYEEAMQSYQHALEINPNFAEAWWNKSLVELTLADFAQGWENYEWRFRAVKGKPRFFHNIPLLAEVKDMKGAKILVWHEQGLGDTLQFCRYIPMMIEQGAEITLLVQKPLKELLESLGGCTVIVDGEVVGPIDYQIPLLSIPRLFKTNALNIPSKVPYLKSCSHHRDSIQKIIESKQDGRMAIGVACSGSTGHANNSRRSMPLECLIPLLQFGDLFLIQKDVTLEDQVVLSEHPNIHFCGEAIENFLDSAALVENMDLIVSVDTSLAHLSGALNQKTFICLPYSAEWRWLINRSDSLWYPSVTLFRQENLGDWHSVISQIVAALTSQ